MLDSNDEGVPVEVRALPGDRDDGAEEVAVDAASHPKSPRAIVLVGHAVEEKGQEVAQLIGALAAARFFGGVHQCLGLEIRGEDERGEALVYGELVQHCLGQ